MESNTTMTTFTSRVSRITIENATMKRNTQQRTRVTAALSDSREFISAQDLHSTLGADAPSLATVYRTLQGLTEEGAVDSVNRNGESLYRLCGAAHHHHLVCIDCAATVELDGDEIEEWAVRNASEHGFTMTSHIAEIYGRCATCSM